MKNRTKFDFRNILLLFIGIGIAAMLLELLLQIGVLLAPSFFFLEAQTKEYLCSNKFWKSWHYSNNTIRHSLNCFDATYSTNSIGMKDEEPKNDKFKIALVGDSYIEGYGVNNDQTIPYHLERLLGDTIEAMNFGTSGGFGNVHAASILENFVLHFNPDLVLVFFLSYNDLYDNVTAIDEGYVSQDFQLTYPIDDSVNVFHEVLNAGVPKIINSKPSGLLLPYFLNRVVKFSESMLQMGLNVKFEFSDIIGYPFYKNPPQIISDGYSILENSLVRMKALAGERLVVVNLPTPFQVDNNWKSTFEKSHGQELDILRPNKKLKSICDRYQIELFDPTQAAIDYITINKMEYPYLYNICDKHFNAEGYRMMAIWISEWYRSRNK